MAAPAVSLDRTYPSRSSSHPRKASRPRIEGGTVAVRPASLVGIAAAYIHHFVERAEVRVWGALLELCEQYRLGVASGGGRPVTAERVAGLLGISTSAAEKGIDVLLDLGLVVLDSPVPTFLVAAWQVQNPGLRRHVQRLMQMVGQSHAKSMPLPRRVLCVWYKQRRGGRVEFGVHVGMLLRVLFMSRYDDYKGSIPLSWLEDFADAPRSSVKAARSRLVADGLFETLPTDARVVTRCGAWYRLVPGALGPPDENVPSPVEKSPENIPACQNHARPSDKRENQTRTSPPHTKDATRGVFTQHPETLSANGYQQGQGVLPAQSHQRGSLRGIQRWELRDPQAVDRLFEAAVEAGHVSDTPADRRLVFELACHAVRIGKRKPALFYRCLVTPPYHRFISAEDEDAARRMLAELEAGTDDHEGDEAGFDGGTHEATAVAADGQHGGAVDPGVDYPWEINEKQRAYLEQNMRAFIESLLPGELCPHDDDDLDLVRFVPADLAAVAGVDRETEAVFCRLCKAFMICGEWYTKDEGAAAAGEGRGPSGEDVGWAKGRVESGSQTPTGSDLDLEPIRSGETKGVVPASGRSAVSWYGCQHDDIHRRPVRFAGFDLESAAGVDREAGALFCRTCEGWWVGDRWYRQGDEGGVRAEAEAECGGRSAAGLRDPEVGDLARKKAEG